MLMLKKYPHGFTIVELLIVVVVIAILAAITIVAYNGITQRAHASMAQQGLDQAVKKIKTYAIENSESFPSTLASVGIVNSSAVTYTYSMDSTVRPRTFCVTATAGTEVFHMDQDSTSPQPDACAQAPVGPLITNLFPDPSATTLANFIPANTSGASAIITDGTARTGTTHYRKTSGSALLGLITFAPYMPVTSGETYTGYCWLRPSTSGRQLSMRLTWHDASNNTVGTATTGSLTPLPVSTWTRVVVSGSAPTGATQARLLVNGTIAFSSGNSLDIDSCMVTAGATVYNFADGSSPGWSWAGTPNASTSSGPEIDD